jgi:hypothetical protein
VVLGRKTRGKTQVTAVIYPNRDAVLERVDEASLTPELVRGMLREEIAAQEADVAAYKRVVDVVLTDEPLPKTPLRKVMRGHIRESYDFHIKRWKQTWAEVVESSQAPAVEPEELAVSA